MDTKSGIILPVQLPIVTSMLYIYDVPLLYLQVFRRVEGLVVSRVLLAEEEAERNRVVRVRSGSIVPLLPAHAPAKSAWRRM